MDAIPLFSFVEDVPSREVLLKLVEKHNLAGGRVFSFYSGFPSIMHGAGNIRTKCPYFLRQADSGQYALILTDLDANECPATLIRDWFFPGRNDAFALPKQVLFRIAVRAVEAWLLADKEGFSRFLGVPKSDFADDPEGLPNPKKHLLDVIERKARKTWVREMLPTGRAHIGAKYNESLCSFIRRGWNIDNACLRSPSLRRAVNALARV